MAEQVTFGVKPANKGAMHVVTEVSDRDGWMTTLCGWRGFSAAVYKVNSIQAGDAELPWHVCNKCAKLSDYTPLKVES